MRSCVLVVAACSHAQPSPKPVEPTVMRLYREVMIDASGDSARVTYQLETTGAIAKLVVTHERSAATRLDTPTAWALARRVTFFGTLDGTIDRSTIGASLDLYASEDGLSIRMSCHPKGLMAMPAHARIGERDANCVALQGEWQPAETIYVAALVCRREGSDEDPVDEIVSLRELAFVDPPGVEWVEEKTPCKVFGQGHRWR